MPLHDTSQAKVQGEELDYAEITATTTITPGANAAASVQLIAGNTIILDGDTPVEVEFFCARADMASTAGFVEYLLYDSTTELCRIATSKAQVADCIIGKVSLRGARIPSAGSHQYIIKCVETGSGTLTINTDTGAPPGDVEAPTYIRTTRTQVKN